MSADHPPDTIITVHVQPRAKKTELAGWHGDALKIRISAPPVDGAANDELVRFVAKCLNVPRRSVRISSGATARRKRLTIVGVSREQVLEALGSD